MTPQVAAAVVVRMTRRVTSVAGTVPKTSFPTCVDHAAQTMHPDMCAVVMVPMIRWDTYVAAAVQMTS